jgi:hypothetical protein
MILLRAVYTGIYSFTRSLSPGQGNLVFLRLILLRNIMTAARVGTQANKKEKFRLSFFQAVS